MKRDEHLRMLEHLRRGTEKAGEATRIPTTRYRDPVRFERERDVLFGALRDGRWHGPPRVIAAASSIASGSCCAIDIPGVSAVLTRTPDGQLHALVNACRHRGTRLVDGARSCRALVCPYHGWTYDLAGKLIDAPHARAFGNACEQRHLHALAVEERHGLVWLGGDVERYLGALDADVASLELARCMVWKSSRTRRRCNWKLVIEAFSEGYHIRSLHRDSIYRFFLDASSLFEPVGSHLRSMSARRALREAGELGEAVDLRGLGSATYLLFPATILVEHPEYVSLIAIDPVSVNVTDIEHTLLVPADRAAEGERWDKSWNLIDGVVFQREDLWVCEQVQRGLEAGVDDDVLFGELEEGPRCFHATIDAALDRACDQKPTPISGP